MNKHLRKVQASCIRTVLHCTCRNNRLSPRICFHQSLGRNRDSEGCMNLKGFSFLLFFIAHTRLSLFIYCMWMCVSERELSCGVSERGPVWSSSVFADKSLWVTDWDLIMISSAPPISTPSFLSITASAPLTESSCAYHATENWQN